jgi:hypothetical protein
MATIELRHEFNCDEATFWKEVFFDADFNRKLFLEHLRFARWDVTKMEEDDKQIRRTLEIVPTTGDMPGPLKKFASDLGFREEAVFDKASKVHRFEVIPNKMANKLTIGGQVTVEAQGSGVVRLVKFEVKAKIFGIGGLLEQRIIADSKVNYDKGHAYARAQLGY